MDVLVVNVCMNILFVYLEGFCTYEDMKKKIGTLFSEGLSAF